MLANTKGIVRMSAHDRDKVEAAINFLAGSDPQPKKRDCQLCGYEKAVGKYYVSKEDNPDACGWWRVCSECADMVSNVGADVNYYKYSAEYKARLRGVASDIPDCSHEWEKHSLVGEFDKKRQGVFDWMKCTKCGCFGKRFGLGQREVVDLSTEIDLSCSR